VNQARLAAIVQSSDDAILSKTLDGIITSWNKGAERLYGYTEAEVVGKHVSLLSPPDLPNDIPMIMSKLRRGEQVQHHETTRTRKDGTRIEISVSVSPVHDLAGNVIGASTIARDITVVAKTLENVLSVYTHKLEGQSIKVEKIWESETEIQAVAGEIRQVFSNLIANSIDAMPRGGTPTLKVSKSHDWGNGNRRGVRVVVADTGSGIAPAQQSKLFEPFFTTKRDVGTGLGLWVSRSIVQKHEGFIRVRSNVRPGKSGTVFSVFLPESKPASVAA
jgi:PAS domain S-box-containing protein